ncbi:SpcU [Paludibacterium yongneupense]|uniref:SpcU n=1 Tax=Paludibacterium yongneupense TaxID=400061 RepID=UPI0004063253|nr:SpcU [Paludibacterium yongneupense]
MSAAAGPRGEFRLQSPDGRSLALLPGAQQGDWVLLMRLGPCPSTPGQGVVLLLLQANSPFSDLAPVRLTADGAGELALWVGVRDGPGSAAALDDGCRKLSIAHAYFARVLNATAAAKAAESARSRHRRLGWS